MLSRRWPVVDDILAGRNGSTDGASERCRRSVIADAFLMICGETLGARVSDVERILENDIGSAIRVVGCSI